MKLFETPEVEIKRFSIEDVLTTSSTEETWPYNFEDEDCI